MEADPANRGFDRTTMIETFPNPHAGRPYLIVHRIGEFTSLCPKTGQPDFARMVLRYIPGTLCVELKSLKLHLQAFRNRGIFYEDVTNVILNDLVACCQPEWMELRSRWSVRGGIRSEVIVQHEARAAAGPRG